MINVETVQNQGIFNGSQSASRLNSTREVFRDSVHQSRHLFPLLTKAQEDGLIKIVD